MVIVTSWDVTLLPSDTFTLNSYTLSELVSAGASKLDTTANVNSPDEEIAIELESVPVMENETELPSGSVPATEAISTVFSAKV
jgi:hypothetical protein